MSEEYMTPDYYNTRFHMVDVPVEDIPPGADMIIPIEGDGMEPVFHDGQNVFFRRCTSLFPYDPGAFIVDGKLYFRLFTKQDGQVVLTTYENRREPIKIGPETDFHIIGRALRQ